MVYHMKGMRARILLSKQKPIAWAVRNIITTTQTKNISESAITEFDRNGVVCLRGIFDRKWLDIVEAGIKKNIREPSKYCDMLYEEGGGISYFNDYCNTSRFHEFHDYVMQSPAAAIAGTLMQSSRANFFHEHVFCKEEGTTKPTPWHHDQAYYPFDGIQNCSIWMPTRHVKKENGLKFVKGSHKLNKWFIPRLFKSNVNYEVQDDVFNAEDVETIMADLNKEKLLTWDVEPGDCIAFHMKTIHGAEGFRSTETRYVMSTRWLGDDITYVERPWKTSPPKELLPEGLTIGRNINEERNFMALWTNTDEEIEN